MEVIGVWATHADNLGRSYGQNMGEAVLELSPLIARDNGMYLIIALDP
jgi:hypothetical protein